MKLLTKSTLLIVLCLIALSCDFYAGECCLSKKQNFTFSPEAEITDAKAISKVEYEKILNDLFNKHKKLKYFTANIQQVKDGGVFKRPVKKHGTIVAKLPEQFLLDMSEDGLKIIVDGKYAWIYDTDLDDVEIWDIKSKNTGNMEKMDISSFFLGNSIKTADELEKEFDILAYDIKSKNAHHFILHQKDSKDKKLEKIELTLPYGAILPSFVCSTGIKIDKNAPLKTIQYITDIKTNFDNAAIPSDNIFKFTPTDDMTFRMMDFNGNSKDVDLDFVTGLYKDNGQEK